jgi:hypothetical protein
LGGKTVARPALEGRDKCILHRILRGRDVTDGTCERSQRASGIVTEAARDPVVDR